VLRGFTIAGFRNFNSPQWIYPLERINIFIGSNNSGKSNILRYIKRVVSPALHPRSDKAYKVDDLDRPRSGAPLDHLKVCVDYPARMQEIIEEQQSRLPMLYEGFGDFIKDQKYLNATYRFPPDQTPNTFPVNLFSAPQGPDNDFISMRTAWQLTHLNRSGGGKNDWYTELAQWVNNQSAEDLAPHYIRTFRQLRTRLDGFEDEYEKSDVNTPHLIDEISQLERPDFNQQDKKEKFQRLLRFVRKLLQDDTVQIEVAANKSHIYVIQNNKTLPLEALGSGIHEVFMLAADVVLRDDKVVLIEEPEVHLHPILQRLFMNFLVTETTSQIFITTHSSAIIDSPSCNVFFVDTDESGAIIKPLITSQDRYNACRHLGFKPSDLMQTNCVIWVEGPSDRIYLNNWLKHVASDLVEGVHYSYSLYGGKILSRFTAQDEDAIPEFINMLHINRRCAIVMDSDKAAAASEIRGAKLRVQEEIEKIDGYVWITLGREIENYLPANACEVAIRSIHPSAEKVNQDPKRYAKRLAYIGPKNIERTADKIRIAEQIIESCASDLSVLDLNEKLNELVKFIKEANE
jgi:predicted ATP-dependent endonuclease of OLD family